LFPVAVILTVAVELTGFGNRETEKASTGVSGMPESFATAMLPFIPY
jgi:hypothetical protein